jgi:hypothetical integral membrane protein (TIGR02206 family)
MNQFDSFTAGGTWHLVTLAVFAVVTFVIIAVGRRLCGTDGEMKMRQAIGTIGLIVWTGSLVRHFLPANFSATESFPLQFCDVAGVVACLMFLTDHRWTHSITYFWGIAFCLQAFLTPTLKQGPAHPAFWFFWINHAIILGGALYCVFVGRFRPRWEDFLFAAGTATVWLMFLVAYDIMTGSNYGFVGNAMPGTKTIIDVLGPWPGRVAWIYLIGLSALTVLWLPWHFFNKEPEQFAAAGNQ